ncbi:uncharacterized protein LOC124451613 [Xenia sp. Carnegie-2017]|uniref:uncharacterized protein LOC124451613 n=1 Tax=Xenia sp. Carnegie-2017 TaxID=2897299 RepID=UPI001F04F3A7|nr:uncharacterized protein LOC124451613 [Xenia sp. Carnegie-2017]XP_046858184.1 uncharacterized protein LOC124451613 [Xenia sp. Carnegie-2017]
MSESSEYKLAQTIIWSNQKYLLKKFVKSFNLPQVVLVKDGYCGDDERTTFSKDQILTLHQLRETHKIVCQTSQGKFILLPSKCEVKAQVLSKNFNDVNMTTKQLIEFYKSIKYVRVLEIGANWSDDPKYSFQENDTLEIKKIDPNSAGLRCKNLSTNRDSHIPSHDLAKFVPLQDPNLYSLSKIKAKYGFPAAIWFKENVNNNVTLSLPDASHSTRNLCSLGQLTVVEEIQENDVIVTTVCSSLEEKICLNVPIELNINVTVAEGFLKGSTTYATVVKTLDKQLKKTDLKAFEDLDVYQHMHAVKKQIKDWDEKYCIREASLKITERARQQLQQHERTKTDKAPKFQPSSMSGDMPPPNVPQRKRKIKSKKSDDLQQDTVGVYTTEREKSPTLQDVDIYTSLDPNYCSTIQNNYEPLQTIGESSTKMKEVQKANPEESNSDDRHYAVLENDSTEDKHSYDYIEHEKLCKASHQSSINMEGQKSNFGKETQSDDRDYAVLEKDFTEDKHSYDYIGQEEFRKSNTQPKVPKKPKKWKNKRKTTQTDEACNNQGNLSRPEKSDDLRKGNSDKADIQNIPLPPLPLKLPNLSTKRTPNVPKEDDKEVVYEAVTSTNILLTSPSAVNLLSTNIPPNAPKDDDKEVVYEAVSSTDILPTSPNENDREAIYEAISRYPRDLSSLSVTDVSRLMTYLGLKDYVETFENELIDGSMLITMDKESLEFLNVKTFHCKKLLRFIGGWRPNVGK